MMPPPGATATSESPTQSIEQRTALIHNLQRERGVTCGMVGAHDNRPLAQYFLTRVQEQRRLTDSLPFADMGTLDRLRSIRSSADEAADGSRAASVFYFIFKSFNSLISDVLAESSRGVNEIYDAFARLKEATGIERAFLCGALALPPAASAHLPSRAFAELVIGMQQQRSYEATIRATAPPKLLDLVRAGFEYAPELREVQSRLLETFDVASLRETLGADRCWQMLTDHIDKLERLQGLLHRELQAQRETELATEAALREAIAALSAMASGHKSVASEGVVGGNGAGGNGAGGNGAGGNGAGGNGAAVTTRLAAVLASIRGQGADGLKRELIQMLVVARDTARAADTDARRAARAAGGGRAKGREQPRTLPGSPGLPRSPRSSQEELGGMADEGSPSAESPQGGGVEGGGRGGGGGGGGAGPPAGLLPPSMAPEGDAAEASLYGTRALLREHTQDERMIGLDELVFKRRIGSGSAGVTYLASFEGGTCAVKIATGGGGIDDWKREVRALSRLRHPNIIRCMGVIAATPSFGLVLEFCEGGDLSTRLTSPTPPGFLLAMATGTAAGMLHLHHRGVLHRDLKGGNILIDGSHGVKITDFGLAAFAVDETRTGGWMTAETGTYRWMAPEVCLHEQYSKSADVFSFGCVLFELITHELPWADRPPLQAAVAFGLDNLRPSLPSGVPPAVAALTHGCWLRDATARPTFASIHAELESLSLPARLTPLERTWLDAPDGHPIYSERRAAALPVGDATPRPATTDHGQQQPAEQQPAEQQPAGPHAPLVQLVPACFDALVAAAVHCFDALRLGVAQAVLSWLPLHLQHHLRLADASSRRSPGAAARASPVSC